jgi:hypothetical protein
VVAVVLVVIVAVVATLRVITMEAVALLSSIRLISVPVGATMVVAMANRMMLVSFLVKTLMIRTCMLSFLM